MYQPLPSRMAGVTRGVLVASSLVTLVTAQGVGTEQAELHPKITWQKCTAPGTCTTVNGEIVLDSNGRWTHDRTRSANNCYDGNTWYPRICPDSKTCSENCVIDGAGNLDRVYGVSTKNDTLTMKHATYIDFFTNYGARVFLMADETKYQMFNLLGNEFSFDVDASKLGCGINGALSFVAMDEDGGMARFPGNKAGAKYGTGYCSARCPRNLKWIDGKANSEGWIPSEWDSAEGIGSLGSCCPEVNVWDANAHSTALTIRPCTKLGQHKCENHGCTSPGDNSIDRIGWTCAADGCDFNPYRQGNKNFYGPGSNYTIDTTKKVTVVTQFLRGKDLGDGVVKRFYVQNGKVIPNSASTVPGIGGNQIDERFCQVQKQAFHDYDDFIEKGGMHQMGKALEKPMVLSFSILDDWFAHMLWLDSVYPRDRGNTPGAERGTCDFESGYPEDVRSRRYQFSISNIKFGPINSTFSAP